jgi:hypothetical protein
VINGSHHSNHHQIVLLTNEKIESSDGEQAKDEEERKAIGDEELTSLNWLHDKNLLKGAFSRTKLANRPQLTVLLFTGINLSRPKVQSPTDQGSNGRLNVISKSPHDDKDDSGVSVENGFNSSLEQVSSH